MADEGRILSEVIALVAKQSGVAVTEIRPETRLLHDLSIDGDDANELIVAFCDRFGISCEGFDFGLYFNGEITGKGLLALFTRDKRKLLERDELRIGDLVRAVREKRFWR